MEKEKPIHGIIKLLDDNGNEVLTGNGLFSRDDRKIYMAITGVSKPIALPKYRILFISNSDKKAYLSTTHQTSFICFTFGYAEESLDMGSYVVLENEIAAKQLIRDGIVGISVKLKCKTERSKPIFTNNDGKTEFKILNYGSTDKICSKKESGGKFSLSLCSAFTGNFDEGKITNLLILNIEMKRSVSLDNYRRLLEPLELYWALFKNDTSFDVEGVSFIMKNSSDELSFCNAYINRNSILSIKTTKSLFIERPKINLDILEKILIRYEKGLSKDKIAYGFSKYMFLHKNTVDIQTAVLYSSAALDSISAEISKNITKISASKQQKIKANIKNVRKYVSRQKHFEQETVDFYTSDINEIYNALRNTKIKDAIRKTMSNLGLTYDEKMEKSVNNVLEARNQIIHGQSYNIEETSLDLHGYFAIEEISLDDETKSYIPIYKFGYINDVFSLLTEIGRKLFE